MAGLHAMIDESSNTESGNTVLSIHNESISYRSILIVIRMYGSPNFFACNCRWCFYNTVQPHELITWIIY